MEMTHDYRRGWWGWNILNIRPINNGMQAEALGIGRGVKVGDYLLLSHSKGETRYRVTSIKYRLDPSDMWSANLEFAPRPITSAAPPAAAPAPAAQAPRPR